METIRREFDSARTMRSDERSDSRNDDCWSPANVALAFPKTSYKRKKDNIMKIGKREG